MNNLKSTSLIVLLGAIFLYSGIAYASTILTTQSSDTLNTFRTNVNSSITNLNNDKVEFAYPFTNNATSTTLSFNNGFLSTASSTITSTLHADGSIHFQDQFSIDAEAKSSINRLLFKSALGNTDLEAFFAPTGSNTGSQATFADSPNANNFGGLQIGTNGTTNFISATSSGSGTTLPLSFDVDGTEAMRIDTNGNVGIGTTSPSDVLSVAGDVSFSEGDNYRSFFWDATNGRLGIGTESPQAQLDINYSNDTTPQLRLQGGASQTASEFEILFESGRSVLDVAAGGSSGVMSVYSDAVSGGGRVELRGTGAGPFINMGTVDDSDKYSVFGAYDNVFNFQANGRPLNFRSDTLTSILYAHNTTGNVGIGTTSPTRKLNINDTMNLEPRSTAPSNPQLGDLYTDSDSNELCFYDGSSWTGLKAAGTCE